MANHPYVLWLVWQNQKTRQRYHIGNLIHRTDGTYSFSYELSGKRRTLKEAMNNGYKPHLAFRDIHMEYVSESLFGPFARRLPDKRRPDFNNILTEYGLPNDYTDMDLLRATGGRLATDPYEFVAPINMIADRFFVDFYIAGWRHYSGDQVLDSLKKDHEVRLQLEPDNQQDYKAVKLLSSCGKDLLGYVPAFYSGFIYDVISNDEKYTATIDHINPNAKPQLKVNISMTGELSQRYSSLNDDGFEPVEVIQG